MTEVWIMINDGMNVFGWFVGYFLMGLFVARRVRPPRPGSWIAFRLAVAVLWPPVSIWLVGRWAFMNGLLFLSDHVRTTVQFLEVGRPVLSDQHATANHVQPSDGEKLRLLYADRQRIEREIGTIKDRMAKTAPRGPSGAPN